jgi:uncharacterized Zn-binding protein involved in type VI secretion
MPGPPVTLGCVVTLTPGAVGAPDTGAIIVIPPPFITFSGLPLATAGSTCQMINSVTGVPYPIVIPPLGASTGVKNAGMALVRMGDRIVMGPAILLIGGPPAAPTIIDTFPP